MRAWFKTTGKIKQTNKQTKQNKTTTTTTTKT